ncbi:heavy metal-binding protein HIP-like [Ruditapes philippinarum]|uniref:heavy metal-binding protein HIP-like n=1 Tax=Ruditapes philippinarum TaxID=129788 RepID=UPI00295B9070|nr:heavy metal-binding protein HIP-like [Ruditapes philippinarum]
MDAVSYTGREAIKFSNIVLNKGDSYDNDTGNFTAPIAGIYQFNAHICIKKGIREVNYYIKVGNKSIVTGEFFVPIEAEDRKCTSFSAAALVPKGDSVRVGGMLESSLDESDNDQCSFSGTLIQNV